MHRQESKTEKKNRQQNPAGKTLQAKTDKTLQAKPCKQIPAFDTVLLLAWRFPFSSFAFESFFFFFGASLLKFWSLFFERFSFADKNLKQKTPS